MAVDTKFNTLIKSLQVILLLGVIILYAEFSFLFVTRSHIYPFSLFNLASSEISDCKIKTRLSSFNSSAFTSVIIDDAALSLKIIEDKLSASEIVNFSTLLFFIKYTLINIKIS